MKPLVHPCCKTLARCPLQPQRCSCSSNLSHSRGPIPNASPCPPCTIALTSLPQALRAFDLGSLAESLRRCFATRAGQRTSTVDEQAHVIYSDDGEYSRTLIYSGQSLRTASRVYFHKWYSKARHACTTRRTCVPPIRRVWEVTCATLQHAWHARDGTFGPLAPRRWSCE